MGSTSVDGPCKNKNHFFLNYIENEISVPDIKRVDEINLAEN